MVYFKRGVVSDLAELKHMPSFNHMRSTTKADVTTYMSKIIHML